MSKEKIKEVILETAREYGINVEKIILFGSRARGDFKESSDWDILIVVEDVDRKVKYKFISAIMKKLIRKDIFVDIIVVTSDYYKKYKDIYGDICGIATLEGVPI